MNTTENHTEQAKMYAALTVLRIANLEARVREVTSLDIDADEFAIAVASVRNLAYTIASDLDSAVRHANTAKSIADLEAALA